MRLVSYAAQALLWAGVLTPSDGDSLHDGILSRKLKKQIHEARERWHVKGITVVVVTSPEFNAANNKGDVWRTEIVPSGEADAKGNKVTEDSLFGIASNSKLFTALAIGFLIEQGTQLPDGSKLDWSTKIKDILPEWELADEYASEHADIVDLGSMRSGLPSHDIAHKDQPVSDMIKNLRNLRSTAEIRQEFQYNNEHYFTLSAVIPALTSLTFDEFVQQNFFDPLGMSSTTYNATLAEASGRRTDGFTHVGQNVTRCRERSKGAKHMDKSCHGTVKSIGWWEEGNGLANAGAGGVISSGKDIAKWLRELLHPKVVPPHLIQKCATPVINSGRQLVPGMSDNFYGMGQVICYYKGHEVVYHTGGVPGQTSVILRLPSKGLGVAVLTNDSPSGPALFFSVAVGIVTHLLAGDSDSILAMEDTIFAMMTAAPPLTPLPANPSPPQGGYDSIPGTYDDPGYGEFTLSKLERDGDTEFYDAVLQDIESHGANAAGPIFIAPYDRTFVSHIALTPFDGQFFNFTVLHAYKPDGKLVIDHMASGPAVVTDAGVGMFDRFNSQGEGIKLNTPAVEDVENKATVWFKRR